MVKRLPPQSAGWRDCMYSFSFVWFVYVAMWFSPTLHKIFFILLWHNIACLCWKCIKNNKPNQSFVFRSGHGGVCSAVSNGVSNKEGSLFNTRSVPAWKSFSAGSVLDVVKVYCITSLYFWLTYRFPSAFGRSDSVHWASRRAARTFQACHGGLHFKLAMIVLKCLQGLAASYLADDCILVSLQ